MKQKILKYSLWVLGVICVLVLLNGCVAPSSYSRMALLPEDRIFTAPAGQVMNLVLDGKPLSITFPKDMKVVDSSILVSQEEKLNKATIKNIQGEKFKGGVISFLTALFGAIAAIFGIWAKNKVTTKKES